ncbi:rolling-circle replication protein [Pleurochrysis carterae circular virus]|uniref:rolling-circle replication protein n=1 Tax=Pleurochrysis carterae circular virus TaxID=2057942 RepID=UPI000C7F173C|nr:rolling-circle replication protein [Pleurochrysis carterae circular virus]AUD57238.1 rolling-circle replication protein [Pleurochrysis carterae circular virus]|eukprot:3376764-Pleurochrysis_carterae.AAC.1
MDNTLEMQAFAHASDTQTKKFRNFVFTKNNYSQEDLDDLDSMEIKYLIYGKESAPTTGTPHLQGFVVFKNQRSTGSVCKELKCWARPAKTTQCAIAYCKKDGDFVERGTPPMTQEECGKKGEEFYFKCLTAAEEGRFEDIPASIMFTQDQAIHRHRQRALLARELKDTDEQMLWYWGAPGTGKSKKARGDHPGFYLKMCNKWWDGYSDQEVAILEDFDKKHEMLGHHLKIWGDRYPFPAEIKGGAMVIRPKLVIVTSNWHPSDIWSDKPTLDPILRRFKCIEFKALNVGSSSQNTAAPTAQNTLSQFDD